MATVAEQWIEEGKEIEKERVARELIRNGADINLVIKATGYTKEALEKLSETVH